MATRFMMILLVFGGYHGVLAYDYKFMITSEEILHITSSCFRFATAQQLMFSWIMPILERTTMLCVLISYYVAFW